MKPFILFILFFLSWEAASYAQGRFPADVEAALTEAGDNRTSLEAMLERYKRSGDSEQYAAACFLVANMGLHYTGGRVISYDAAIDSFRRHADAVYYSLINGTTAEMQETDPLHRILKDTTATMARAVQTYPFTKPEVEADEQPDIRSISASFLSRQIEQAFALRRSVERVRRLPFADFLEYILPYRAISGYPLVTAADTLHHIFAKYLKADTAAPLDEIVARYNRAVYWMRHSHGRYPFETTIGLPDLFFTGVADCIDMAEYGAQALRACGIPAVVETNVAYRIWASRHYMVAVPDGAGHWLPFNPESGVPRLGRKVYGTCLNIHRLHFSAQQGNPAAIVGDSEPLPEALADPCIEDVSREYMDVATLTLPATSDVPPTRQLAYLATFRVGSGLTAVTWGTRTDKGFTFHNVVKDNVYFPVWGDEDGCLRPMGQPFSLRTDSTRREGFSLTPLPAPTGQTVAVTLHRKYPRKPHLIAQAERTVGTVVLGCDSLNFRHVDTLAVITTIPDATWTDLPLHTRRPYRYYRVRANAADPHLHLAEIQFLTARSHGYNNVIAPTPLADGETVPDTTWQRLMDAPLEKCKWKAEYDGNVQTAPDAYPDVTLKLDVPQWVERLRYVVKHADNGICAGDHYRLCKWGAQGWKVVWLKCATSSSLDAGQLEVGGLYWLSDLSRGKEELPFLVAADGTVSFPHDWVVADVESGRH